MGLNLFLSDSMQKGEILSFLVISWANFLSDKFKERIEIKC